MNSCFWFIKLRFVHFFLLAAPGRCETDFRFGGQRRGLRRDAAVALDPKNLMVKIPWWKWRENFRLRSGKKHFYGNQGTGRKKTWAAKLTYVEKDIRREISLVFFRKNVGSSFHVGSILVDFDVECMQWIWWIWWIWIRHAREMSEMCAWMYSWIDFFLIYVDLCWFVPRWFPTQKLALASWRNYFGCGTRGTRLVGKLKSSLLSLC